MMGSAMFKIGLLTIASRAAVTAAALFPKVVYLGNAHSGVDGGCKEDEQYMMIKTNGDLKDFKKYGLAFIQKDGKCGKTLARSEPAEFSAVFHESDVGMYEGLSLHVCAPYGTYNLELEVLDSMTPVSGEIGWEVYQSPCEVEPKWKLAPAVLRMGSYEYPGAGGSPLYAGPNPAQAPECEADNYLGLGVDAAPAGAKLEGCYLADTKNPALDGPSRRHNTKMEAQYCAGECKGYMYFGTSNGDRCTCSNETPATKLVASCYTPCSGKTKVACGGCSAMTVFKFDGPGGPAPTPTHKPTTPKPGQGPGDGGAMWKYVACFEDDGHNRVLGGPKMKSASGMTAQACSKFCEDFMFFGTEFGQECYCGKSEPSTKSTRCNKACTGDATETCGGRDAISVYKRDGPGGPSPTPPQPTPTPPRPTPGHGGKDLKDDMAKGAKNMGCYEDDGRKRVLDGPKTRSRDMDAEYCSSFCKGYKYFGTEFGDECFCGNSEPSRKSYDCDMSCSGKSGVICGGRDAITIYKRDGDGGGHGGGGGGGKMEHIACYRDDGRNRIMKMASWKSEAMTPKKCGDFCMGESSRAKYFGVEFGKECFCSENSFFMDKDPIGPYKCDMFCSGDRNTYCGGRDAMNAYKL